MIRINLVPKGIGTISGYGLPGTVFDVKHGDMDGHAPPGKVSWYRCGCAIMTMLYTNCAFLYVLLNNEKFHFLPHGFTKNRVPILGIS
jgi:hypothetical protein